jgi:molybdopterin converting factor small subunit
LKPDMIVVIEFLGMQRTMTGADSIKVPITARSRVDDVLEYVRSNYPQLHLDEGMVLVTVNQDIAPRDRVLKPDDIISFLPFISGG